MALLSAGVTLASLLANLFMQQAAANDRKRAAAQQEKLLKTPQKDIFGNTVQLDEAGNTETTLTPIIQAILDAQQAEQYKQLTEDAPQARVDNAQTRRRNQQINDHIYNQFNEQRYGRKKSEKEYEAEALRNALMASKTAHQNNDVMAGMSRMAMRMNNSNILNNFAKAAQNNAQPLAEILFNAKTAGRQNYQAEKPQTFLPRLSQNTSTAPQMNLSSLGNNLFAKQNNLLSQALIPAGAQSQNAPSFSPNSINELVKSLASLK